jgi:hypothetical protein
MLWTEARAVAEQLRAKAGPNHPPNGPGSPQSFGWPAPSFAAVTARARRHPIHSVSEEFTHPGSRPDDRPILRILGIANDSKRRCPRCLVAAQHAILSARITATRCRSFTCLCKAGTRPSTRACGTGRMNESSTTLRCARRRRTRCPARSRRTDDSSVSRLRHR